MKKHIIIENFLLRFSKFSNRVFGYFIRNRLGRIVQQLKQKKIKINYIYDIGANKGEWSNFYKKTSLSNSKFYLFEANKEHKQNLEKTKFSYFFGVLSNKKKIVKFYNNNNSTGDSYYKENTENHQNIVAKKIKTKTLNEIVKKNNLPLPDLIKLDVQGAELDILKGGDKILKNCKILYLECPIIAKFNQNNLNILHYLKFADSLGFMPFDINQISYYHGYLVQLDIIFIKKKVALKLGLSSKLLKSFY